MAEVLSYQDEPWDELLDGQVVAMSPRPSTNHNFVAENIFSIFRNHLRGKQCRAIADGTDLYLTDKDRVVPDVMVICNRDLIKSNGVHGAPDLVVEVLSRRTAKNDKGYKKDLYGRCGVHEYWLVEVETRSIEVYLLQETGGYRLDNRHLRKLEGMIN